MLTAAETIDIFLRVATIGQVALIILMLVICRRWTVRSQLTILSLLCLAAYLVLTAPSALFESANPGPVMAMVHSLPVFAWLLVVDIFSARPWISRRPALLYVVVLLVLGINAGIFWAAGAPSLPHQASHWLALILLSHLLFLALRGIADDLVPARRSLRAWFIAFFVAQFLVVVVVEITGLKVGNPQLANLINAGLILVMVLVLGVSVAKPSLPELLDDASVTKSNTAPSKDGVSGKDRKLRQELKAFMDGGGYTTPGLGIRQLARILAVPEHRLRQLINQGLGYRNFSTFLNSYRIDLACRQLADPALDHVPILTIALDAGYGSIGPFNRAFKSITGKTPSEYRRFRNRP